MYLDLVVSLLALLPCWTQAQPFRIRGETNYPPYSLVRLQAEGVDAKAALLWRVYPSKDVEQPVYSARQNTCLAE